MTVDVQGQVKRFLPKLGANGETVKEPEGRTMEDSEL